MPVEMQVRLLRVLETLFGGRLARRARWNIGGVISGVLCKIGDALELSEHDPLRCY
jgi:hypothetical protein